MARKTLCLLLTLLLLLSLLPFSPASAVSGKGQYKKSGDFRYQLLEDGTVIITSYLGKKDKVTIPDKIQKKKVTVIESGAFTASGGAANPSQVTLPKYLREINSGAFTNSRITSITIPASVEVIWDHAFCACDNLKTVIFEKGNVRLADNAFLMSDAITEFRVPADHPTLEVIDGMLFGKQDHCLICCPLPRLLRDETFTVPDGTEIIGEQALPINDTVRTVILPDSVREIRYYSLSGCMELERAELSAGLETIGLCAIGGIASVTVPESNPYLRTDGGAIYSKDGRTLVWYPRFLDFYEVTIPSTVTRIGSGAFYSGNSLTKVIIPDSVTEIGDHAFYSCNFPEIVLPDSIVSIGDHAFSGCSALAEIVIPGSVTEIGESAFAYCDALRSVRIPESITALPKCAFTYCSSLEEISLPGSISSIGERAFESCGLVRMDIPEGVSVIGKEAFSGCLNLASVTLPSSLRKIKKQAFRFCHALTEVTVPEGVTAMDSSVFDECANLTTVRFPASVTEIRADVIIRCPNIKNIYVVKGSAADKVLKKNKPKPKYK